MSIKEFAEKISGFEYPARELSNFCSEAYEKGYTFIYGMSDDNLIWEGFSVGNRGAYGGCEASIGAVSVRAEWAPDDHLGTSWKIHVDCDHEVFTIVEDGDVFCYGAVIDKSELVGGESDLKLALKELVSIVEIHQKSTGNNFAWAEIEEAKRCLDLTKTN